MMTTFTKMQGLGNDFVVIDATQQRFELEPSKIQAMADRHFGIGFDQMLVLEKASNSEADFDYRIFNADGSEVEQCGNGARCIALYIKEMQLSSNNPIVLNTQKGNIELMLEPNDQVRVAMGEPTITMPYSVLTSIGDLELGLVSIGNPHAVMRVADVATTDVNKIGELLNQDTAFPDGVNVGFMQIVSTQQIKLRVYERGVGETLACGTGACAALAYGYQLGVLGAEAIVSQAGGDLVISWQGPGYEVNMLGPGKFVFKGEWLG